eukprot:4560217-Alexandrium_andersonii.AAC.1
MASVVTPPPTSFHARLDGDARADLYSTPCPTCNPRSFQRWSELRSAKLEPRRGPFGPLAALGPPPSRAGLWAPSSL